MVHIVSGIIKQTWLDGWMNRWVYIYHLSSSVDADVDEGRSASSAAVVHLICGSGSFKAPIRIPSSRSRAHIGTRASISSETPLLVPLLHLLLLLLLLILLLLLLPVLMLPVSSLMILLCDDKARGGWGRGWGWVPPLAWTTPEGLPPDRIKRTRPDSHDKPRNRGPCAMQGST